MHGVADEGGWWPDFDDQRAGARDAGARRSSAPASCPASRSRSRSTSPPPSSAAAAATRSASSRASSTRDGMIELLLRWIDAYPIVSIEDPLGRGRRRWVRALHPRRRRARCRSSATTSSCRDAALVREAAAARRRQHGAAQAEPARHADAKRVHAWRGGARASATPASSRRARARPRTRRSSIWRSAGAPASSRSARSRAASGWRSGTRRCASRSGSARGRRWRIPGRAGRAKVEASAGRRR